MPYQSRSDAKFGPQGSNGVAVYKERTNLQNTDQETFTFNSVKMGNVVPPSVPPQGFEK